MGPDTLNSRHCMCTSWSCWSDYSGCCLASRLDNAELPNNPNRESPPAQTQVWSRSCGDVCHWVDALHRPGVLSEAKDIIPSDSKT